MLAVTGCYSEFMHMMMCFLDSYAPLDKKKKKNKPRFYFGFANIVLILMIDISELEFQKTNVLLFSHRKMILLIKS